MTEMMGRMAGREGGGVSEQGQREAAFDFGRQTGNAAAVPSLPYTPMVPPKQFLAAGSGGVVSGEAGLWRPEELAGGVVVMVSPTSTLQTPTGSASPTSAATTAVPFSRRGTLSSLPSSSAGDDRRRCKSRSRSQHPWEARPVGVGLAGALSGDADALPPVATVLTGQRIRPCPCRSSASSVLGSVESRSRCRGVLSPREMMEASEDYTRVIARGPNPRTTHIFDDRVVVVEDEFLRWCHGCSKDLGQGNDIFMYRGEMAFCSHECRYRVMLLLDEEGESS